MASGLESYVNHTVSIITSDGRNFVGTLRGFDQTINLILDECHERVYSQTQGVEQVVLGLHIIRGDNVFGRLTQAKENHIKVMCNPVPEMVCVGFANADGIFSSFIPDSFSSIKGYPGGLDCSFKYLYHCPLHTSMQNVEKLQKKSKIHFNYRAVVGEVDDEMDSRLDMNSIRADPLGPVVH